MISKVKDTTEKVKTTTAKAKVYSTPEKPEKKEPFWRSAAILTVQLLCGIGASVLVGVVVKGLTPSNIGTIKKVGIALVGFGLAGVVAKAASDDIVDFADAVLNIGKDVSRAAKEQGDLERAKILAGK